MDLICVKRATKDVAKIGYIMEIDKIKSISSSDKSSQICVKLFNGEIVNCDYIEFKKIK